jgi:hypothetical protein
MTKAPGFLKFLPTLNGPTNLAQTFARQDGDDRALIMPAGLAA